MEFHQNYQKKILNGLRDLIISCLSFKTEKRQSFSEIFEIMKTNKL